MSQVKKLNIKNQTRYSFSDMINIENFQSNLLSIDKQAYTDFDDYYLGYITIKQIGNYENIHSVNPLYLKIHSAAGYFKKKNDEKYLILHSTKKYEEVFSKILLEIKTTNGGKKLFYEKNYAKICINTNDDVPLNKRLKFLLLTIIIRRVLQINKELYQHIYEYECKCKCECECECKCK